jgi:hypothetical protein
MPRASEVVEVGRVSPGSGFDTTNVQIATVARLAFPGQSACAEWC